MKTQRANVIRGAVLLVGLLALGAEAGAVPTDDYYIFSDVPDSAWVVRNGAVQNTFPHQVNDLAIAVSDTIRALNWARAGNGSEYDLNGTVINNGIYAPIPGAQGELLDGTTDGSQHNYTAEWGSALGSVWQTDRNWENGVKLFDAEFSVTGITYDGMTDTLWLAEDNSGEIFNYDLSGNVIDSFNVGSGRWGALAWEPSTDTLWMIDNDSSQMIQTDKSGNPLSSMFIEDFGNVWGGEFAIGRSVGPVPEPATLLLLSLGLVGLRLRRTACRVS